MNNKEKYKQAFSVLHASEHISLEDAMRMVKMKPKSMDLETAMQNSYWSRNHSTQAKKR